MAARQERGNGQSQAVAASEPVLSPGLADVDAGRPLDFLCAQCVGWKRVHFVSTNYLLRPGVDLGLPRGWLNGAEVDWEAASMRSQAHALVPPHYSTVLSLAWNLVQWMEKEGYWCQMRTPFQRGGRYWCGVTPCNTSGFNFQPDHWYSAESMPLAMCRSFLSYQSEQDALPDGVLVDSGDDSITGRWFEREGGCHD